MYCNQCGTQVPDTATTCFYCGAALTPIYQAPQTQVQNIQTFPQQVQNPSDVQMTQPDAGLGNGIGQPQMPSGQQMTAGNPSSGYGQPMPGYGCGYGMPQQPPMPGMGAAFKSAPGEFAGKVKRMGISIFCLLGLIAAMLFFVSPFLNFVSIHVNQKLEVPSYSYGSYFNSYDDEYGQAFSSKLKLKACIGLDLFELSQLSATVSRLADQLGADTDNMADMVERTEHYIILEMEDELGTNIKESTFNEIFGTAKLVLKGRIATLITPWILIICGCGLFLFSIVNHRKLKMVFSIIPLACLIWLMVCSGHFFSIMGVGAWAIILGILLGLVSAVKDA